MERFWQLICLCAVVGFIWLSMESRKWIHAEHEDIGYTKSDIQQHSELAARSVKQVARAEAGAQQFGQLMQIEPDGSPEEVVFYQADGSVVK